MTPKAKRVKAGVFSDMYCVNESDVPALIDQMADDYLRYYDLAPPKSHRGAIAYILKRAGITGPKAERKR